MKPAMKISRACAVLSILGLLISSVPQRAVAQYTNPYTFNTWNNPVSSYMDTVIQGQIQRKMLERSVQLQSGRSAGSAGPSTTQSPAPRYPISATDFRATGTRLLPDTLAAATPDATTEQKRALRAIYMQSLAAFEQEARRNNVAYALAFVLGVSIQVTTGNEVPDAEAHNLARDLNDVLAGTPEFRRLSPRDKQALYEAVIITGGFIAVIHQMGTEQNDDSLRQQARELAQSVLAQLAGQR